MPRRNVEFRNATARGGWIGIVSLVLTVAGCSDDGDYPRGWAPLRAPATVSGVSGHEPVRPECPDLAGLYRTNDSVIFRHLIARRLTREQSEISWFRVEIGGRTGDSLRAIVARNDLRDTVWMTFGRDFNCNRGWLTAAWPEYLLRMRPSDEEDDSRGYQSRLDISRDTEGRLIGRMTTVSYKQVAVWCGDGCKYVMVPFTRKTSVRWHRMSTDRLADADNGEEMLNPATAAQIAREEAALEAGTPPPMDALGNGARLRVRVLEERAAEQVRRIENGEPPPH